MRYAPHTYFTRTLFALALVVLPACIEYETTTTVNDNGSFTRSIILSGDSAEIHRWDFTVPVDSSWSVSKAIKGDDGKWTLRAERTFASGETWDDWRDSLQRRVLGVTLSVERSFRFFTTTYRYSETIASYNPFRRIPLTDYLSQSELDAFLRFEVFKESYPHRGDSLALHDAGDRFEEWEKRTRIESYFAALEQSLEPALRSDSARLAGIKASMIEHVMADSAGADGVADAVYRWAQAGHRKAVLRAIEAGSEALREFTEDVNFINSVGTDTYVSHVRMPGTITSTNGKLEGANGATWDNYIAYAYIGDFTMVAESSVVNIWAFVLALGVIIGAPMLVWVARMVRKRRNGRG